MRLTIPWAPLLPLALALTAVAVRERAPTEPPVMSAAEPAPLLPLQWLGATPRLAAGKRSIAREVSLVRAETTSRAVRRELQLVVQAGELDVGPDGVLEAFELSLRPSRPELLGLTDDGPLLLRATVETTRGSSLPGVHRSDLRARLTLQGRPLAFPLEAWWSSGGGGSLRLMAVATLSPAESGLPPDRWMNTLWLQRELAFGFDLVFAPAEPPQATSAR